MCIQRTSDLPDGRPDRIGPAGRLRLHLAGLRRSDRSRFRHRRNIRLIIQHANRCLRHPAHSVVHHQNAPVGAAVGNHGQVRSITDDRKQARAVTKPSCASVCGALSGVSRNAVRLIAPPRDERSEVVSERIAGFGVACDGSIPVSSVRFNVDVVRGNAVSLVCAEAAPAKRMHEYPTSAATKKRSNTRTINQNTLKLSTRRCRSMINSCGLPRP